MTAQTSFADLEMALRGVVLSSLGFGRGDGVQKGAPRAPNCAELVETSERERHTGLLCAHRRVIESRHFSRVSAGLAGVALGTFRGPNGPDEAFSALGGYPPPLSAPIAAPARSYAAPHVRDEVWRWSRARSARGLGCGPATNAIPCRTFGSRPTTATEASVSGRKRKPARKAGAQTRPHDHAGGHGIDRQRHGRRISGLHENPSGQSKRLRQRGPWNRLLDCA